MAVTKKKKFHFDVSNFEPIECSLMEQREFAHYTPPEGEAQFKEGKYHGSMFWEVDGFGSSKWVVCARIVVDWEKYYEEGLSEEELFGRCVAYLNLPPKRRKFQRRITKPKYGKLSPTPMWIKPKEEDGVKFLSVLMVTDKKRCRYFWGEGPANVTMASVRKMKKARE